MIYVCIMSSNNIYIYIHTTYYAPPHPFILQDTSGRNIFLKYWVCKAVCWPTMCRRCAALCGQSGWALRIRQKLHADHSPKAASPQAGKPLQWPFPEGLDILDRVGGCTRKFSGGFNMFQSFLQSRFWKTILV